jgi:hypothetical protein
MNPYIGIFFGASFTILGAATAVFPKEIAELGRMWSQNIERETHIFLIAFSVACALIFFWARYIEGWRIKIYNINYSNE